MHFLIRKRESPRGVYFMSTLVVALLVSMLVLSALSLSRGLLKASRHLTTGETALSAAESGLRYAQAKLGANPSWKGNDNGITVDQEGLTVREQDGNVIGVLTSPDGTVSQFRIRFNWQDDSGSDVDGFDDPSVEVWVDHPFVSVNNVSGGSPADIPRGEGANFSVTDGSPRLHQVPPGATCIQVEGRSGAGLGDIAPGNLNPEVRGGSVSTKVVEAYFEVANPPGADAAAMAAGDFDVELLDDGSAKITVDSKSGIPRVRSKADVKVEGGDTDENYVSDNGEVYSGDGSLQAGSTSQANVTTQVEQADAEFYKLSWDDVKKATSADHQIDAGTYVLWDNETLHYYDMNYDEYVSYIKEYPNDGQSKGVVVNLNSDAIEHNGKTLKIKGNVLVASTTDADEFNFIPRRSAQEDPDGAGGGPGASPTSAEAISSAGSLSLPYSPAPGQPVNQEMRWKLPYSSIPASDLNQVYTAMHSGDTAEIDIRQDGSDYYLHLDMEDSDNFSVSGAGDARDALAEVLATIPPGHFTASSPTAQRLQMNMSYLFGGSGGMSELDLPSGIPANLTADDLEVTFEPEGGGSAILSADGNVNIGSKVKGQGGSITSQGDIRIVGAGSDLSANVEDGLNLYAKKDVVLSSLLPKDDGTYEYKSFKMKGVIYAWGDFIAKIGVDHADVNGWGDFELQGALVAYGNKNQPELSDSPGEGDGGAIEITAKQVKLTFDAAYLSAFQAVPEPGPMTQTFFSVR